MKRVNTIAFMPFNWSWKTINILKVSAIYFVRNSTETNVSFLTAMSGKILQVLYDKEVLGHDIILEWADDKDPKSSKGKAVAVLNANRFLDWLRETEGEDDDQTANEDDQTKNENTNNKN